MATRHGVQVRTLLVGLLLVGPLAATAHAARSGPVLHDVAVEVVGPPVVSEAAARALDADDGVAADAVEIEAVDPAADVARDHVADHHVAAAVVVDLAASTDTLLVPDDRSSAFVDELTARVGAVAEGYGRRLRVERVEPASGVAAPRWAAPGLLLAWAVAGLLLAGAVTLWRGPVPADQRRARARLGLLAGAGVLVAVVAASVARLAWSTPFWSLVVTGTTVVVLTAWLTTAAENLLGLPGLAVAWMLTLAPLTPLLLGHEPDLLPQPWFGVRSVLPHDAAFDLTRAAAAGAASPWHAVAVLAAWAVIALVALAAAYRFRPA